MWNHWNTWKLSVETKKFFVEVLDFFQESKKFQEDEKKRLFKEKLLTKLQKFKSRNANVFFI